MINILTNKNLAVLGLIAALGCVGVVHAQVPVNAEIVPGLGVVNVVELNDTRRSVERIFDDGFCQRSRSNLLQGVCTYNNVLDGSVSIGFEPAVASGSGSAVVAASPNDRVSSITINRISSWETAQGFVANSVVDTPELLANRIADAMVDRFTSTGTVVKVIADGIAWRRVGRGLGCFTCTASGQITISALDDGSTPTVGGNAQGDSDNGAEVPVDDPSVTCQQRVFQPRRFANTNRFRGVVTIENIGTQAIDGWSLSLSFDNARVIRASRVDINGRRNVTASNTRRNRVIEPGQSVRFSYIARGDFGAPAFTGGICEDQ